jgi:TPR repeat protein
LTSLIFCRVGYFYDEGLPNGVCNVDIIEAVKWYSVAAELMPDSMHNLAKIYEDGRFVSDLLSAPDPHALIYSQGRIRARYDPSRDII